MLPPKITRALTLHEAATSPNPDVEASIEAILGPQSEGRAGALALLPFLWPRLEPLILHASSAPAPRTWGVLLFRPGAVARPAPIDPRVRAAAETRLAGLVDRHGGEDIGRLEREYRDSDRPEGVLTLGHSTPRGWAWLPVRPPPPSAIPPGPGRTAQLVLLALSRDGYVRQAAVRALADCDEPAAFACLLWRAGDFVRQVREEAEAGIRRWMTLAPPDNLAAQLPRMLALRDVRRPGVDDLAQALTRWLADEPDRRALKAALSRSEASAARAACALAPDDVIDPDLARLALAHPDPLVRRWAQAWEPELDSAAPALAAEMRLALARDPQPAIRARGLTRLAERDPSAALPLLRSAVADLTTAVRYQARHLLKTLDPGFDAAQACRAVLADPGLTADREVGAVRGLGEVGAVDDLPLLLDCLAPGRRSLTARSALQAMHRLDAERGVRESLAHLADERPGVGRTALSLLPAHIGDAAPLIAAWEHAAGPPQRQRVAFALARLEPWNGLERLLERAADPRWGGDIAPALMAWRPSRQRRAYVVPPPPEAQERRLRDFLAAADLPQAAWTRIAAFLDDPMSRQDDTPTSRRHL